MKPARKILSGLLAAVLVAQTGLIGAWATGTGTTPPACNVADHGQTGHNVTNVNGCTADVHWLGGTPSSGNSYTVALTGAAGTTGNLKTNYYYVELPADATQPVYYSITCQSNATDIIVATYPVNSDGKTINVTVDNFNTNEDKIYVLGTSTAASGNSGSVNVGATLLFTGTGVETSNVTPVPNTSDLAVTVSGAGGATTVTKGSSLTLTATASGGVNTFYSYKWEKSTGANTWTTVGTNSNTYTIPATETGTSATVLKYRCTVRDAVGTETSKEISVKVEGCDVTASLKEIADSDVATTYTGNQTIALPNLLQLSGTNCTIHTGENSTHGYTVEWNVSQANGVSIDGSNLKVVNDNLTQGSTQVTLTATLKQGTEGKDTKTKNITITKATTETCDPNPTVTLGDIASADITITGGKATISETSPASIQFSANLSVTAVGCTDPNHGAGGGKDPNHGYSVKWSLTGAGDYAKIDEVTGQLTITSNELPTTATTATLTATVYKDENPVEGKTATLTLTFQRSAQCNYTATVSATDGLTRTVNFDETEVANQTTKAETFNVTVNVAGSCELSHNHTPQWTTNQTWATVTNGQGTNQATVTIKGSDMPSTTGTVTVTCMVSTSEGDKTVTYTINATREKKCDKVITEITQITGAPEISVNNTDYSTQYSATVTDNGGKCEFEGAVHSGSANHTIKWMIREGGNNGITITEDGLLNVDASQLSRGTTYTVILRAYLERDKANVSAVTPVAGTVYKDCTIKVTRTSSSSGNTGSSSDNDDSDSRQWESIRKEIRNADRGDTIKVRLGSNTELPAYVLRQLDGENVTLQMTVSGGYVWTVNGKSVKRIPSYQIYIPLDVEEYSNSRMLKLCRDYDVEAFRLRHTGSFYSDMKLTIDVGSKYAKDTLYLYSYNEDTNKLTYRSSAKADSDGEVTFTLTSSAGNYVITSKALYGESAVSGGGGTISSSSSSRPSSSSTYVPPASSAVSSSSSSSSSSESSSESSEPEPPVEPSSSSQEESEPTDTQPEEDSGGGIPVLVPILIIAIAGVITATVLIVRGSGKNRGGSDSDDDFDD